MADLAATLGMPLDEWQEQALESAMGERSDGRWASKFVGISAPRQNGKSQLIVARALAGVLLFDEKVIIISAHETDTAREIWKRLIDVIEANPTLEARVTARMNAVNRESLTFGDGLAKQTIKIKARSHSGSRGFSADCLLLDEAQILGKHAWGSIVPTMSARPNPQLWLFGTPPTITDDPFAFTRVRESSMAHKARHCWLEWSASEDDDIDDPATWAKANPAYGVRISYEACADDRSAMDDDQFRMERLGMWDTSGARHGVIPRDSWDMCGDETSLAVDRFSLGIEVGSDQSSAAVVLAGARADGRWHVELDEHRQGAAWLPPYVEGLVTANPQLRAVVGDVGGPLAAFVSKDARGRYILTGTRVVVTAPTVKELGSGCSNLLAAVVTESLAHVGQPQLTSAVSVAGKRALGDTGLWTFSRMSSASDITPVLAMNLALIGAQSDNVKRPGRQRAEGAPKRRAVVL